MSKKILPIAFLLAACAIIFSYQAAFAHTTVHVGNYDVEVGWLDEPPIVGQRNAIVVNVSNPSTASETVDISKLTVDVTYGGQTKILTLQPLSEDAANQYIAPILPTIPGQYTVQLRGLLGSAGTPVNTDVNPEEVGAADSLAFPNVPAQQAGGDGIGWTAWLAGVGFVAGLGGLILGFLAYRRKS